MLKSRAPEQNLLPKKHNNYEAFQIEEMVLTFNIVFVIVIAQGQGFMAANRPESEASIIWNFCLLYRLTDYFNLCNNNTCGKKEFLNKCVDTHLSV